MKKNSTLKGMLLAAVSLFMATAVNAQTVYYEQDYENATEPDWTTSVSGRHTPMLAQDEDGNHYLCADPTQTYNNGAILTGPNFNVTEGVKNVTALFDLRITNTNEKLCSFVIKDSQNGDLFVIKAKSSGNTVWVVNGSTEIILPGTNYINNSTVNDRPWYRFQVTWNEGITYLEVLNPADPDADPIFAIAPVTTLSTVGGMKNMIRYTERNLSKFAIDNVTVRDFENNDIPAATPTSYTIKYRDQYGNQIKDDVVNSTIAGAEVSATAAETANFFNEEHTVKYIYVSGNDPIIADESASYNVIILVYREAETFSYTVNAVTKDEETEEETVFEEIATGSDFEGETIYVPYSCYINVDGTLYSANATNKEYRVSVVLSEDEMIRNILYAVTDINNVCFFSEGENLENFTASAANNADIRCSNAFVGFATEDTEICTLRPGKYAITADLFTSSSAGGSTTFTVGERAYTLSGNASSYHTVQTTPFFEITEESVVTVSAGSKSNAIDYLYIVNDDEAQIATAINEISTTANNQSIFNMQGMPVMQPVKGLYIQNGKKYVVK